MGKSTISALLAILIVGAALTMVVNTVKDQQPTLVASSALKAVERELEQPHARAPLYDYKQLRHDVMTGRASLADARRLMTDSDPASLANSIHSFFTMRRHRGVLHLLDDMWNLKKQKYPELSWDLIAKAPARIALASTINRINVVGTDQQKEYIREHKAHKHEFVRAQVAVALGFNGEAIDLPYLQEMCDGENHYVAQSAITGLSLFGGGQARTILIEMGKKHSGTPRGDLIYEMLGQAYQWSPAKAN